MTTSERRGHSKTAVHLWEFLLDLLADENCSSMIGWTNREGGEFKLKNQEEVAKRWGDLKRRPGMNYDKLSRALRYYYQKGIIKKVNGQRLAYRFVNPPVTDKPTRTLCTHASLTKAVEKPVKTENQMCTRNTSPEGVGQNTFHYAINPVQNRFSFPTLPTLPSTTLGLQFIQSPLRMSHHNHVTYPTYQYVIPFMHPSVCPCH
ncbi:transcriptional regulator ERG homolog isoform X2 [Actinia tenebrosa]|nr:transcriptional regulator ERG homolog isoform X2 [Actinia tenebrosa]